MKIAVLGAGFAGLATAYYLSQDHEVTLFDPNGIGNNASGIAAGLLHTYAGAHAKLNWRGHEGLKATRELMEIASEALGEPVYEQSGLLRVAIKDWQKEDYARCAGLYSDVQWLDETRFGHPGIFIDTACVVNTKKYLEGLLKACKDVTFEKKEYEGGCDCVVACMGAATEGLIKPMKGQLLEIEWPKGLAPLPYPVNSQAYLVMRPETGTCIIGATFEKEFANTEPDLETALRELKPKYTAIIPELGDAKVVDCRAALRATTPNHRPLLKQIDERSWVLTGFGSKGLLYHALFAQELATNLFRKEEILPRNIHSMV